MPTHRSVISHGKRRCLPKAPRNASNTSLDAVLRGRLQALLRKDDPDANLLLRAVDHRRLFTLESSPAVATSLAIVREVLAVVELSTDAGVRCWAARATMNITEFPLVEEPDPMPSFAGLPRASPNSWRRINPELAIQRATFALLLHVSRMPELATSCVTLDGAVAVVSDLLAGADRRVRRAANRADKAKLRPYHGTRITLSWEERAAARSRAAWRARERLDRQRPAQRPQARGIRARRSPTIRHRSSAVSAMTAAGPRGGDGSDDGGDGDPPPRPRRPKARLHWSAQVVFGSDASLAAAAEKRLTSLLHDLLSKGEKR